MFRRPFDTAEFVKACEKVFPCELASLPNGAPKIPLPKKLRDPIEPWYKHLGKSRICFTAISNVFWLKKPKMSRMISQIHMIESNNNHSNPQKITRYTVTVKEFRSHKYIYIYIYLGMPEDEATILPYYNTGLYIS